MNSEQMTWHWYTFEEMPKGTLYDYLRLRQQVFIIEQRSIYPDLDDVDQFAHHLLVFSSTGNIAACLRLIPPDGENAQPHIGRLLIAPEFRGQKLAHVLIDEGLKQSRELFPDLPIRIGAQTYLKDFYIKHGFEPTGEPYDDEGVEHIDMQTTS